MMISPPRMSPYHAQMRRLPPLPKLTAFVKWLQTESAKTVSRSDTQLQRAAS